MLLFLLKCHPAPVMSTTHRNTVNAIVKFFFDLDRVQVPQLTTSPANTAISRQHLACALHENHGLLSACPASTGGA